MKHNLKAATGQALVFFLFTLIFSVTIMLSIAANAQSDQTTTGALPALQPATQSELKPHIGLQLGFAEPGDDHDAAAQYGIEMGYQPYVPFGAALEVNSFLTDRDNESNLRRTSAILKGTYNFGGANYLIRHSFVGTGIGAVIDTEGEDETNLGIKALAGMDFPLNRSGNVGEKTFTLGATASYLSVINAQDTFALNGQLKYWF